MPDAQGTRWITWLNAPQDPRALAAFRVLFGALLFFAVVRTWAYGWIEEICIAPSFHFTYFGFEWVRPWPAPWMYAHFAVMAASALALMVGAWTRASAGVLFVTFTYAELIEKAAYLNHYYLISLLSLLLIFVPAGAVWSVDAWRRRSAENICVGRWAYLVMRCQVAVVYVFAGLAKLNSDWLLRAEPLATWLQVHTDVPLVGGALGEAWMAYLMSWGGMLYDLTIVPSLLWAKSRPWAYAVSVFFHVTIWLLFPVGVFSWTMLLAATLFFDPAWPRKWVTRMRPKRRPTKLGDQVRVRALPKAGAIALAAHVAVQVLVPMRFVLYPGYVNWKEEGFRFAWRVMLIEKAGQVEFEVQADERQYRVYPRAQLTQLQYRMMSTQPDMIHEYALELAKRFRRKGHRRVQVRAHAWASLNGRPSQRFIDPCADLASAPRTLAPKSWLVPLDR